MEPNPFDAFDTPVPAQPAGNPFDAFDAEPAPSAAVDPLAEERRKAIEAQQFSEELTRINVQDTMSAARKSSDSFLNPFPTPADKAIAFGEGALRGAAPAAAGFFGAGAATGVSRPFVNLIPHPVGKLAAQAAITGVGGIASAFGTSAVQDVVNPLDERQRQLATNPETAPYFMAGSYVPGAASLTYGLGNVKGLAQGVQAARAGQAMPAAAKEAAVNVGTNIPLALGANYVGNQGDINGYQAIGDIALGVFGTRPNPAGQLPFNAGYATTSAAWDALARRYPRTTRAPLSNPEVVEAPMPIGDPQMPAGFNPDVWAGLTPEGKANAIADWNARAANQTVDLPPAEAVPAPDQNAPAPQPAVQPRTPAPAPQPAPQPAAQAAQQPPRPAPAPAQAPDQPAPQAAPAQAQEPQRPPTVKPQDWDGYSPEVKQMLAQEYAEGQPQSPVVPPASAQPAAQQAAQPVSEAGKPAPSAQQNDSPLKGFKLYRGYGRPDRLSVYGEGSSGRPIFGTGKYYAFSEREALEYGPQVEKRDMDAKNPLVISDDDQWRQLVSRAGWRYDNPMNMADEAEQNRSIDSLVALIKADGHDAVVIQGIPGPNARFVDKNVRTLRNVFGQNQVVFFEDPLAPTAPTPQAQEQSDKPAAAAPNAANKEAIDKLVARKSEINSRIKQLESELKDGGKKISNRKRDKIEEEISKLRGELRMNRAQLEGQEFKMPSQKVLAPSDLNERRRMIYKHLYDNVKENDPISGLKEEIDDPERFHDTVEKKNTKGLKIGDIVVLDEGRGLVPVKAIVLSVTTSADGDDHNVLLETADSLWYGGWHPESQVEKTGESFFSAPAVQESAKPSAQEEPVVTKPDAEDYDEAGDEPNPAEDPADVAEREKLWAEDNAARGENIPKSDAQVNADTARNVLEGSRQQLARLEKAGKGDSKQAEKLRKTIAKQEKAVQDAEAAVEKEKPAKMEDIERFRNDPDQRVRELFETPWATQYGGGISSAAKNHIEYTRLGYKLNDGGEGMITSQADYVSEDGNFVISGMVLPKKGYLVMDSKNNIIDEVATIAEADKLIKSQQASGKAGDAPAEKIPTSVPAKPSEGTSPESSRQAYLGEVEKVKLPKGEKVRLASINSGGEGMEVTSYGTWGIGKTRRGTWKVVHMATRMGADAGQIKNANSAKTYVKALIKAEQDGHIKTDFKDAKDSGNENTKNILAVLKAVTGAAGASGAPEFAKLAPVQQPNKPAAGLSGQKPATKPPVSKPSAPEGEGGNIDVSNFPSPKKDHEVYRGDKRVKVVTVKSINDMVYSLIESDDFRSKGAVVDDNYHEFDKTKKIYKAHIITPDKTFTYTYDFKAGNGEWSAVKSDKSVYDAQILDHAKRSASGAKNEKAKEEWLELSLKLREAREQRKDGKPTKSKGIVDSKYNGDVSLAKDALWKMRGKYNDKNTPESDALESELIDLGVLAKDGSVKGYKGVNALDQFNIDGEDYIVVSVGNGRNPDITLKNVESDKTIILKSDQIGERSLDGWEQVMFEANESGNSESPDFYKRVIAENEAVLKSSASKNEIKIAKEKIEYAKEMLDEIEAKSGEKPDSKNQTAIDALDDLSGLTISKADTKELFGGKKGGGIVNELKAAIEADDKAKIQEKLGELQTMRDGLQDRQDNTPESLQETDAYYAREEAIEALDVAIDEVSPFVAPADEAAVPGKKGRKPSKQQSENQFLYKSKKDRIQDDLAKGAITIKDANERLDALAARFNQPPEMVNPDDDGPLIIPKSKPSSMGAAVPAAALTDAGVAAMDIAQLGATAALADSRLLPGLNPIVSNMHLIADGRDIGAVFAGKNERFVQSGTMSDVANMFAIRDGNTPAGAKETFYDERDSNRRIMKGRLAKAFEPMAAQMATMTEAELADADLKIAKMVTGEMPIDNSPEGQVAKGLKDLADRAYDYAKEAGLEIGKAQDYGMPHSIDIAKVEGDQSGFLAAATRAYAINNPMRIAMLTRKLKDMQKPGAPTADPDEVASLNLEIAELTTAKPAEQAQAWLDKISLGAEGADQTMGLIMEGAKVSTSADFMKSRMFAPQARAVLRDFYKNDARLAWSRYIDRVTTLSEFSRRFGAKGEKWLAMVDRMRAEGASEFQIQIFKDHVKDALGTLNPMPSPGHALANSLLALSNMAKLKTTALANFLEPMAAATRGDLTTAVTGPILMMHNTIRLLAEMSPADAARFKTELGRLLNDENGDIALARAVGLIDAAGAHGILDNSGYTLDTEEDYAGFGPALRGARMVNRGTNAIARAYGLEVTENAKRATTARLAVNRIDGFVDGLVNDSMLAAGHAAAFPNAQNNPFSIKAECRMRLRRAGVSDADMDQFAQDWIAARKSGKFVEWLSSDAPSAKLARKVIRMESSLAMVNTNRGYNTGGERGKLISQDHFFGKAAMTYLRYPAAALEQVFRPLFSDVATGAAGGNKDIDLSSYSRFRMISQALAIPAMMMAAAAYLLLRDMIQNRNDKSLMQRTIEGYSYTGAAGGKAEFVNKLMRGEIPPVISEIVKTMQNISRAEQGKGEKVLVKDAVKYVGQPGVQAFAAAMLPPALGVLVTRLAGTEAAREETVGMLMPNEPADPRAPRKNTRPPTR